MTKKIENKPAGLKVLNAHEVEAVSGGVTQAMQRMLQQLAHMQAVMRALQRQRRNAANGGG